MLKKLISGIMAVSLVSAMFVMPAHASSFSNDNWVQYKTDIVMAAADGSSSGSMTFKQTLTEIDGEDWRTAAYAYANSTTTVDKTTSSSAVNPFAFRTKNVDNASSGAKYAHTRFYLAAYSDAYRTAMDYLEIRADIDGTGSSRDEFILKRTTASDNPQDGVFTVTKGGCSNNYYCRADRGWMFGNGPANSATATSDTTRPNDSDYHKIDIITDLGGAKQGMIYLYIDDVLRMVNIETDVKKAFTGNVSGNPAHFHGVVIRMLKGKYKLRNKSDYIAMKFDTDRVGIREYYDTDDYKVTFEDVLQDAGLGAETTDPTVIYRTPNMKTYIAATSDVVETTVKKNDSDTDHDITINPESVVYENDNKVVISHTATDTSVFEEAARLLAGGLLQRLGHGISYASYASRAKYIQFSFDQTILSDSSTWVSWDLFNQQPNGTPSLQMWNNEGNLVVSKLYTSESDTHTNKTLRNVTFGGKNHFDWVIDPVAKKQYLYVNGEYVGYGSISTDRILDWQLATKGDANAQVAIEDWSMTLYNSDKDFADLQAEITGENISWLSENTEIGFDRGYAETGHEGEFAVYVTAKTITSVDENPFFYTVIYDKNNKLVDIGKVPYVSERTVADETEENLFSVEYDGVKADHANVYIWSNMKPQIEVKQIDFNF